MSNIETISVIGRGDFGQLVVSLIPEELSVTSYGSKDTKENITTIGTSDVIVLSIPLTAYPEVLDLLAPVLKPQTLVVDFCSVKTEPAELFNSHLPNHKNILLTHPLFGPQSFHNGEQHTLVVTNKADEKAEEIFNFCSKTLGLRVLHMSNEEHDKRMAEIHVLTFFIARALADMNLQREPFMTPSFNKLLDLVALDSSHTEALFQTIQNGNPYGAEERQRFIDSLIKIQNNLS